MTKRHTTLLSLLLTVGAFVPALAQQVVTPPRPNGPGLPPVEVSPSPADATGSGTSKSKTPIRIRKPVVLPTGGLPQFGQGPSSTERPQFQVGSPRQAPRADLALTDFAVQNGALTYAIRNQGTAPAGEFDIQIICNGREYRRGHVDSAHALGPGEARRGTMALPDPATMGHVMRLGMKVDPGFAVLDADRSNNFKKTYHSTLPQDQYIVVSLDRVEVSDTSDGDDDGEIIVGATRDGVQQKWPAVNWFEMGKTGRRGPRGAYPTSANPQLPLIWDTEEKLSTSVTSLCLSVADDDASPMADYASVALNFATGLLNAPLSAANTAYGLMADAASSVVNSACTIGGPDVVAMEASQLPMVPHWTPQNMALLGYKAGLFSMTLLGDLANTATPNAPGQVVMAPSPAVALPATLDWPMKSATARLKVERMQNSRRPLRLTLDKLHIFENEDTYPADGEIFGQLTVVSASGTQTRWLHKTDVADQTDFPLSHVDGGTAIDVGRTPFVYVELAVWDDDNPDDDDDILVESTLVRVADWQAGGRKGIELESQRQGRTYADFTLAEQ